MGCEVSERDGALPGGQRLANQGGSRLQGTHQARIGTRSRTPVESGKRHDVGTGDAPCFFHDESAAGSCGPAPEVGLSLQSSVVNLQSSISCRKLNQSRFGYDWISYASDTLPDR